MPWRPLRDRICGRRTLLDRYRAALSWLERHTTPGQGVAVTSANPIPYPEVTGYFIPTLMQWGEHELALQYGRWLVSIQNEDGSWCDPTGAHPYTFDTGQILKGLLSLADRHPQFEEPARRGCGWLFSRVQRDGRVTTPDTSQWGLPGGRMVPEAIHLYALEPLAEGGRRWNVPAYHDAVDRALSFYQAQPGQVAFTTLSHFHAYIVEALVDLGCRGAAAALMSQIDPLQRKNGAVPAYADCRWVCSTGLFQYALVWYKLGDVARGDRAFDYACSLQNATGGFYGGYGMRASYFPRAEIGWAVKYFLDALHWKIRSSFDISRSTFPDAIAEEDGRYRLVADVVSKSLEKRVLDAGCGRGRFLRRLAAQFPQAALAGLDLSERMLEGLPAGVSRLRGGLLDIPSADGSFDVVFCCEALEHAVNVPAALRELKRVLKKGGTLVIIDKDVRQLGRLKIAPWEQWFSVEGLKSLLSEGGYQVSVARNLSYDGQDGSDGLFAGWVAR